MFQIEVVLYDPHYFIFDIGLSLSRYEEEVDGEPYIRKTLQIGLLLIAIRFSKLYKDY